MRIYADSPQGKKECKEAREIAEKIKESGIFTKKIAMVNAAEQECRARGFETTESDLLNAIEEVIYKKEVESEWKVTEIDDLWVTGESIHHEYEFTAMVFDEPSKHGIKNGRISKLKIWKYNEKQSVIAEYDREWVEKPTDNKVLNNLIKFLESLPSCEERENYEPLVNDIMFDAERYKTELDEFWKKSYIPDDYKKSVKGAIALKEALSKAFDIIQENF